MGLRSDRTRTVVASTYSCMPISFALVSVTENTNRSGHCDGRTVTAFEKTKEVNQ